jgi:hypothetical protein
VLLHFINASHARKRTKSNRSYQYNPLNMDFIPHIEESCKIVMSSYGVFKKKARDQVKNMLSIIRTLFLHFGRTTRIITGHEQDLCFSRCS